MKPSPTPPPGVSGSTDTGCFLCVNGDCLGGFCFCNSGFEGTSCDQSVSENDNVRSSIAVVATVVPISITVVCIVVVFVAVYISKRRRNARALNNNNNGIVQMNPQPALEMQVIQMPMVNQNTGPQSQANAGT